MTIYQGKEEGKGLKIAIVCSRFNWPIVEKMLQSAMKTFLEKGVLKKSIDIAFVPGAFEIPLVCEKMAETKRYDAILTLGAVIKGETLHFDLIAKEVAEGILSASVKTKVPILFSVLTCFTEKQALERAGKKYDLGKQNAIATLIMANLMRGLHAS